MKRTRLLPLLALLPCLGSCAGMSFGQGYQLAQAALSTAKAIIPISEEEEAQIGKAVAARVAGRYGLLDDQALTEYVSLVGLVCAANSERPGLPWRFAVLKSDEVNAFAAPGGYLFITRGALREMDNEAQLAGVLSHEITHVAKKHILAEIQKANLASAGKHLAEASGRIPSGVLEAVADKGADVLFKGYSRSDEYEADAEGTALLFRSGYPADGLLAFLRRLSGDAGKSTLAVLSSTHPRTEDRIGKVVEEIKNRGLVSKDRPSLPYRFKKNAG